ncbi:MAG TPA: cobalamin-binding protein [Acidimicrobiia bacterium]|nr:cobalamin-binding protein [Acidimicrobiia bacterium]HIL06209.1 cobalamin-binding protein [Acidimicrobiia bacterium]
MASTLRVVSLVPSVTETLLSWGIEPIACTRFCEQPSINHVGGTKDPDLDAIEKLNPDLVVVDREENRLEDYQALRSRGINVESLHVASLNDVGSEVQRLADRVGVEWSHVLSPRRASRGVRAFVPIWRRPWMTIGADTYGATVLSHLGIDVLFANSDDTYPVVEERQLVEAEIDVVLAPSEPYPFGERHLDLLKSIAPVMLVDGQDLFWWGARTSVAIDRFDERLQSSIDGGR